MMGGRLILFLALMLAAAGPARAQMLVSPRPDAVALTIYRQPGRTRGAIDPQWPRGYALVTETRTVDLPQGESVIRFEGVAEGLMPETAVLSGLPHGVREKNRDARLLSPAGLVDAYLKRSVRLRRTDRATGRVTEQDAVITAGPAGGVIVRTAQGYEALGCSGLPERMLYPEVPAGLSARPTLSVIATADRPMRATVQLTYLAQGFDWAANYVAERRADGRIDLMAWLTLANGGVTGFADAKVAVIAGHPNREAQALLRRQAAGALSLRCWPMDGTSTHPRWGVPPAAMAQRMERAEDIVVTGARLAAPAPPPPPPPPPEDVGDLKLYRIPFAVDVAASGQKQVALLRQPGVATERLYAATIGGPAPSLPMTVRLRLQNRAEDGLGIAMPAGRVALFEQVAGQRLLAGEADVADKAAGERIDYDLMQSPDVRITATIAQQSVKRRRWIVSVTNARPQPVTAEVTLLQNIMPRPKGLERRGDGWVWRMVVPANGKADYRYDERLDR